MNLAILALVAAHANAVPALPEAVAVALEARRPGHQRTEIEQEGAHWEVELTTAEGARFEALLDAKGGFLHYFDEEDEEEIAPEALPAEVIAAAQTSWPGATLLEAEREGKAYEVELKTADGDRVEALFRAHGALITSSAGDEAHDDEAEEED